MWWPADGELVVAVGLMLLSGAVWLVYRAANPFKGAEHYYAQRNKMAYRLMKLCYYVIIVAFMFNARYIVSAILGAGVHRLQTKLVAALRSRRI